MPERPRVERLEVSVGGQKPRFFMVPVHSKSSTVRRLCRAKGRSGGTGDV